MKMLASLKDKKLGTKLLNDCDEKGKTPLKLMAAHYGQNRIKSMMFGPKVFNGFFHVSLR